MDYFEEDSQAEGESREEWAYPSIEHTVFLIDAGPDMQQPSGLTDLKGFSKEDTWVDVSLKVARETLKSHIIGSPSDQFAVIFYGTEETKNAGAFPHVYTFQELEQSTAMRIKEVDGLIGQSFPEAVGPGTDDTSAAEHLRFALWTASHTFQGTSTRVAKRVMLFTNNGDPLSGASDSAGEAITSRAQQLHESQIEVDVVSLSSSEATFSTEFWSQLIGNPESEAGDAESRLAPVAIQLRDLDLEVRRRAYKKRSSGSFFWNLGPSLKLGVRMYALIMKARPGAPLNLDNLTNAPVKVEGKHVCADSGQVIDRVEQYCFPKRNTAPNFPMIVLTAEERAAVKKHATPGLRLLGFKPLISLADYHQLRSSSFLYPDERALPGSATAFIALHARLLERSMYALCCLVRSRVAEPRLVALLPQEELLDEAEMQIEPPGFDLVHLPFADDIRHPESDPSFTGPEPHPSASEGQVEAARRLLDKLQLPNFSVGQAPNPHLQRHYQVLEAKALQEEEPPEFGPDQDFTQPDNEGITRKAGQELQAFKESVYGEGNEGLPAPKTPARKRKADEPAGEDLDFRKLAAEGKLSKLTIAQLKVYIEQYRLSKQGRKDDLIERIVEHLAQQG